MYRLAEYDGRQPHHPLLLAIKGRVLDVRGGADFYGPDGPYKVMSGRDASKGFAMMSLKEEDAHADQRHHRGAGWKEGDELMSDAEFGSSPCLFF